MNAEYIEQTVKETAVSLSNPTVSELVDKLVKEKGLKVKEATRAVYVLWKKGDIDLAADKPLSPIGFTFGVENLWFWGVTALVALSIIVVFAINASALLYVRYALGGVFVLFLPGFMLISALYPRGGELDALERFALSIGLSLAVVPLIGLLLNYTPWGIRLDPIMVSMALFSEVMAAACVIRRFRYYQLSRSI